ncbi:MAG: redoxin domain-containing protein [Flavobacteriales bacterium]|nr:redoxin domain-containing protein [Flavobacteriales bacterium]
MTSLVLLCAAIPGRKKVERAREAASVGRPFPEFRGVTLRGHPVSDSVFQGRVTLVSAWRIGCFWCMQEIAEYNALLDSVEDPRFQILSFAPQTREELDGFYGEDTSLASVAVRNLYGAPAPSYDVVPMCEQKRENAPEALVVQCDALEELLGADGLPVTLVVGPDGFIRHRHDGMLAEAASRRIDLRGFRRELDSLLRAL